MPKSCHLIIDMIVGLVVNSELSLQAVSLDSGGSGIHLDTYHLEDHDVQYGKIFLLGIHHLKNQFQSNN